ncbi:MAG: hypothetical protein KA175_12085 [Flavobacteriales bacterium]|nr:hypothetical protein [Flavobacteriales bacterium]MBP7409623.1 hypothetical protein [Flavobacteriales bacterium]
MFIIDTIGLAGFALLLLFGILFCMELGVRWGRRQQRPEVEVRGFGPLEAGVFSLLALLLAFTFGDAMTRWEMRRQLMVQEVNAIATAYLRLDLLQEEDRRTLQQRFERYVDARLDLYAALHGQSIAIGEQQKVKVLQDSIWSVATTARHRDPATTADLLLLPALNQMFDITTTREAVTRAHPPAIIYLLLFVVAMVGALIAGYGIGMHARRSLVHMVAFASVMAFSIWVIMELEFPRRGLIRLDPGDQLLHQLLETMR